MKKNLLSIASLILFASLSFGGVAQAATSTQPAAKPAVEAPAPAAKAPVSQVEAVNINTASVEELQKSLKGIGKVKAQAIVDYRTSNGPFTTVDQLLEVKGIGKGTLDKNRDRISL
ncbi:helix-hairpin-helix domain-containing protein [Pseudomonas nicosulfuronedens]|uniref:Helix-hairpin-helix domain-containing protein n=1 Tax=Pseudomonas nicosulfuronedens TaxID=2571105 RepID=A0A5R9RRY5_9PSED|nr:helix-hairpin-helix domain-containing protein [Pseudomonas nicosulfuronedens]MDH1010518.1 helix-hairpin-helix domain-containing protein [Pseudomonas nicosulfuronedens]MDH1979612.1 helix-hairpin-helix domain-containing protein [Pseudomonas nicosulfuronedens]MDH2028047.1 helix-hairpin-helix domain-containing protein [Pseudomonas nicosulfuronedens]TLX80331.1 helix-hairpin-helix domain-containing protein [Pseudomonas nicosulfuronedens]